MTEAEIWLKSFLVLYAGRRGSVDHPYDIEADNMLKEFKDRFERRLVENDGGPPKVEWVRKKS